MANGDEFEISAQVVVNATGPFADKIRKMDDPEIKPILSASSGIHIVLDKKFSPLGYRPTDPPNGGRSGVISSTLAGAHSRGHHRQTR